MKTILTAIFLGVMAYRDVKGGEIEDSEVALYLFLYLLLSLQELQNPAVYIASRIPALLLSLLVTVTTWLLKLDMGEGDLLVLWALSITEGGIVVPLFPLSLILSLPLIPLFRGRGGIPYMLPLFLGYIILIPFKYGLADSIAWVGSVSSVPLGG